MARSIKKGPFVDYHVLEKVERLDNAGTVVLDEGVVVRGEVEQQLATLGLLEVDDDAALVCVVVHEVLGVVQVATHAAPRVAPRRLHLHHVRAEPGEPLRAGRPRLVLRHVEDAHSLE